MSRRHYYHHHCFEKECATSTSCKPTLPSIILLILIILQFGGNNCVGKNQSNIDNGILFIIALFFLTCCNPCRTDC